MDNILERAIVRVDVNELINLWDILDHEIYRCILLVNIDHLYVKMNRQLFTHLSQVFITYEYSEVYNRIFLINRFHEAVIDRDFFTIKELYTCLLKEIDEGILLNILANNLDVIIASEQIPLISLMATYFCNSPHIEEYEKICHIMSNILS